MSPPAEIYRYQAFGLQFASQLELPELMPGSVDAADVTIRLGAVAAALDPIVSRAARFQSNSRHVLLWMDGVARYLITDGTLITVELASEGKVGDARVFLLSVVLGALLHRRGLLALHGAAVAVGAGAVAFVGPSGSGKSTLVAALARRGHAVLSDDIASIELRGPGDAGIPWVHPGGARIKLWADVLPALGESPARLERVRSGLNKYYLPLKLQFCSSARPLSRIYVLGRSNAPEVGITPLHGIQKVRALANHTYRGALLPDVQSEDHFHRLVSVAQHVAVARLERPLGQPFDDRWVTRLGEELA